MASLNPGRPKFSQSVKLARHTVHSDAGSGVATKARKSLVVSHPHVTLPLNLIRLKLDPLRNRTTSIHTTYLTPETQLNKHSNIMFPQRAMIRTSQRFASQLRSPAIRTPFQRRFASSEGSGFTGAQDNAFNRERKAVKDHAAATSGL
jgi:hypothetical protein